MTDIEHARDLSAPVEAPMVYSFCTLMTRSDEYANMVAAFIAVGFGPSDCEFLFVDNSAGNAFDAFSAYNKFLLEARGRYVVLCHQDIVPLEHDRAHLDTKLDDLARHDPDWAVCGNAGGLASGDFAIRISHPGQTLDIGGPFPVRVASLDENFLLVRREANLALSHDLSGFHWYGSDLCIIADILGWTSYVIDFHLMHKSRGNIRGDFKERGAELRRKYAKAFRPRWQYVVTKQPIYLSSSLLRTFIFRAVNSVRVRSAVFWRERVMRRYAPTTVDRRS